MPSDNDHSLEKRITDLEEKVRLLERRLSLEEEKPMEAVSVPEERALQPEHTPASAAEVSPPAHEGPRRRQRERVARPASGADSLASIRKVLRSEDLISKLGIFLLLFGTAFMFKWGIDRGWITPLVRVIIGAALGTGLVGFGTWIRRRRVRFGQVLQGGGIAALYITLFSAFQLYQLLPYAAAFTLMVAVTLVSFALSLRQSDVVLAIIATAGGLGTPFLLFEGSDSILWLVVYTCAIAACAIAIFFEKGWRSLLLVAAAGAWSVMTYAWSEIVDIGFVPLADRTLHQLGVIFLLGAVGIVPIVRDYLSHRSPDRWTSPALRWGIDGWAVDRPALWLTVIAPLVSLALSHEVWDLSRPTWGAIEIVLATGYWAAYLFLRTTDSEDLSSSLAVAASLVLAVSWFHVFESQSLRLLALAAEATAIHVATRVAPDRALRAVGHVIFVVVGAWVGTRLIEGTDDPSLFTGRSATHIGILVMGLVSSTLVGSSKMASTYRVVVALLLAAAWFSFFADGSNRFLALSLQAAFLILWTQYHKDPGVRMTGHALFAVALLAIDWRLTSLPAGVPPLVNTVALVDLAAIVVALGCSFLLVKRNARLAYRFGAYLVFLGWFWRDLAPLDNGHAFISLAWGVIAVALIMIGWRTAQDIVRVTGLTTLGVVVVKLFVIDLAELGMGWRVALFLGLGALLLATSYLFPSLWRGDASHLAETRSPESPEENHLDD